MKTIVLLLVATLSAAAPNTKQFRNDYTYNRKADAFYKLHLEQRRSWVVRSICEEEGSKLMEPLIPEDIVQVHGMMKQYPDLGDYVYVESDGQDHTSAEEVPIIDMTPTEDPQLRTTISRYCTVMNRSGAIENDFCYKELPFVCKVDAKDAPYDPHCGTYGRNYHYEASVGSCYRISKVAYSWDEAYAECRAENSHLVVINSQAEQEVVHRLLQEAPKVTGAKAWFFYFAGFRAEPAALGAVPVFKTIFNETLEQAGCVDWSPNEPNNSKQREYCGTIFVNDGKFNDVECSHKYGFVCEKNMDK